MHDPNLIYGAEHTLGINESTDRLSASSCNTSTGESSVSYGSRPDRSPTISATVEVPASYGFDTALRALQQGGRVTRAGWNGRGQHVEMQRPDKQSRMTQPYAVLRNSSGDLVPWVPSQGDLFASDWAVLPS